MSQLSHRNNKKETKVKGEILMGDFISTFFAFNQNAFFEIMYFVSSNLATILGLGAIAYLLFTEVIATDENAVRDERQII